MQLAGLVDAPGGELAASTTFPHPSAIHFDVVDVIVPTTCATGSSGAGSAGVPDSDWVLTVFDQVDTTPDCELLASIVKAYLDHSPWNCNWALDRAVREAHSLTKFQTYRSGSSSILPCFDRKPVYC
jgi:hypothetical protein